MGVATKEAKEIKNRKVESEKIEIVNGIDKRHIDHYRVIEKAEAKEKENHESLLSKLSDSEKDLEEARKALQLCQEAQLSKDLTTIDDIQRCRNATEKAAARVRDFQTITQNLKTVLHNSGATLTKLSMEKTGIQQRLYSLKKDEILKEIHKKIGDLGLKYLICLTSCSPGIQPNGLALFPAGTMEKLRGESFGEMRKKLFQDILDGK
ncbi:MAG: hypothetical protein MRK02_11055 [Candidatus Scalindua sp.]|nr:hypothetical protein [Candidatus Scalindua sp.]